MFLISIIALFIIEMKEYYDSLSAIISDVDNIPNYSFVELKNKDIEFLRNELTELFSNRKISVFSFIFLTVKGCPFYGCDNTCFRECQSIFYGNGKSCPDLRRLTKSRAGSQPVPYQTVNP